MNFHHGFFLLKQLNVPLNIAFNIRKVLVNHSAPFRLCFDCKRYVVINPARIPKVKLTIIDKLKIIPDAIAAPSCGSLGLSGWLESFVTIKMPAIKPNNEPPVVIKRKTKMPVRYGCARENFIFNYNLRHR